MCLCCGAVDALDISRVIHHDLAQDTCPDARLGPAVEAIIDRRVRSVVRRTVLPATAGLEHMDNAADDLLIAGRLHPAAVLWDRRLNHRVLLIRQPKQVRHRYLPIGSFESDPTESRQGEIEFRA